jgi:hypothetical protein
VGCNPSRIDANADVAIDGTVTQASGPVRDVRVGLMKEPDAADIFFGIASIGLSCLEAEFSECGETKLHKTDASGRFGYALKGKDTQGKLGNASILELTSVLPRGEGELAGPGVSTRFQVQATHVTVPLRMWEPKVSMTLAGRTIRVHWTEPPSNIYPVEADLGAMERSVEFVGPDATTVWRATGKPGGTEFDARLLEDTSGGATVAAEIGDITLPAQRGTDVEVLARSARLPYDAPAGPPPSRGRPCFVPDAKGRPVPQTPCEATDADFVRTASIRTCPRDDEKCIEPQSNVLTIDLGSPIAVTFVVVRGCAANCTVDGTIDGKTWSGIGVDASSEISSRDVVMTVAPHRARYVRVTSGEGLAQLREVSIWDDRPFPKKQDVVVDPSEIPEGRLKNGAPDKKGSLILWIALGVVAAAALATGAYMLGRRRRVPKEPSSASTSRGKP